MRFTPTVFAALLLISGCTFAEAQEQQEQKVRTPQGIEKLNESASSKIGFTFDHSMLVFASKLDPGKDDLRRVIAGVSGISVRNYRFQGEAFDPAALGAVSEEYRAAGWKQVMNRRDMNGVPGMTDLWVRMENNAISNVAILLAKPNQVNFIVVSGSISPMDLVRLGGHFRIPKIEGGVVVPNGSGR